MPAGHFHRLPGDGAVYIPGEPQPGKRNKLEVITYENEGTVHDGPYVADVRYNKDKEVEDLEYYLLCEDGRDPGIGWVRGKTLKTLKEREEEQRREAEKKAKKDAGCVVC